MLKGAVERLHGGTAQFLQAVPVVERNEGTVVWDGIVHVFDLQDHPKATQAYAWAQLTDEGTQRFVVVLRAPPVDTPEDAVRVSIINDYRRDHPDFSGPPN